jgi:hypothetical protein
MHQCKSLLNGKMGICMLTVNLVSVSKKHNSAGVVTICMLLYQYAVPTRKSQVRFLLPRKWDSSDG